MRPLRIVPVHDRVQVGRHIMACIVVNRAHLEATLAQKFSTAWWGTPAPPPGVAIAFYGVSGVGLSTCGDAVSLFKGDGTFVTAVSFDSSTTKLTSESRPSASAA